MDKFDPDLANLQNTQVDHSDVTSVHLLSSEQEDSKMLKPAVVDRIRELFRAKVSGASGLLES